MKENLPRWKAKLELFKILLLKDELKKYYLIQYINIRPAMCK